MAATLKIVARMQAAPGNTEELVEQMKTLVEETRKESGCVHYDLYRGIEDSNVLVFVEEWENEVLWRAHMNGEAIRAFNTRISAGAIASGEIMQLQHVI
ncbi:MAG: putative quinol monooxygenase [Woeseiaceae bacterium]|nr:putative quinol monooxygenase [Woeseiaceae bacterium]